MRRRSWLIALVVLVLTSAACTSAPEAQVEVTPSGVASGASSTVNLSGSHGLPELTPAQPGGQAVDPDGDDNSTTAGDGGNRGAVRPGAIGRSRLLPPSGPTIVTSFDGINKSQTCSGCVPPDPNSASSGSELVELTNTFIQVTDPGGEILCNGGVTLNRLLRTTDTLTDPRIQFDNVNNRFSLTVTIKPGPTDTPALWVAASDTVDACGTWRVYRLTFGSLAKGVFLDFPMLGQDRTSLLISTRNIDVSNHQTFSVFALPKSAVYAGAQVSPETFTVSSLTAPVTNAGQPMISSQYSYFLAAVPGTGYKLYRMTDLGLFGRTLTVQATIAAPFTAPGPAIQPGATTTVDATDGNIVASPYFDGTNIWFAHDFDLAGSATIRYGALNVTTNTVTTAMAFHSGSSDDFNPSIAVGLTSAGPVVFLNWAYTDMLNNEATSDVVDSLPAGAPVTDLELSNTVLVNGSSVDAGSVKIRFGDYSSVSIDPSVPGSTCAWTTQQYFLANGDWSTRIARIGTCQPPVTVPNLVGDTTAAASAALAAAGLHLGPVGVADDSTCNHLGKVLHQSPAAGAQVAAGTPVGITLGQKPPPPFNCP